jgi:hypothetical protein
MAIFGLSFGAKATKIEWSVNCVLTPSIFMKFSAVPVLPQISISET